MTEQDPKTLAENAAKRETFNFAETVLDRAYPEEQVAIILNERAAQRVIQLRKQIEQFDLEIGAEKNAKVQEALAKQQSELVAEMEQATAELRGQTYTVHVQGVSTEKIEELQQAALEAFPVEYTESVSPITGAVVKTEVPNEKRGRYFTTLVRHAHIRSITAPDGAVAGNMTVEEMGATWARMPAAARDRIDQAINDCTLATDIYLELVDEVFSPRL